MTSNSFIVASSAFGSCSGASAKPLRSRRLVEERVDEAEAFGGAVALRELDGLVDHDLRRHVRAMFELRQRDEQDRAADRVKLLERTRREPRDRAVEDRRLLDRESEHRPEVGPVALREFGCLRELPLELDDVVPGDLPLIERFDEQLAGDLPCPRGAPAARRSPAALAFGHDRYCCSLRTRVAISIAVSAASAPLFPAFVPARSTACSIVSTVRRPKPIGTSCSSDTRAIPAAASPAT